MKSTILLLCVAAALSAGAAQTDTVKVFNYPKKVVISQAADTATVRVVTAEHGERYNNVYSFYADTDRRVKFSHRKSIISRTDSTGRFEVFSSGVRFGWGKAKLEGYDFDMRRVDEIGILNVLAVGYHPARDTRLSIGAGFNYRRYVLKKGYCFDKDDDNVVGIDQFAPGTSRQSSKVGLWQITFPVMVHQHFAGKWNVAAAAVLNWNCGASFSNSFKVGDTRTYHVTDNLRQRKFSVEYLASLGYNRASIYFNYAPQSVFKKNFGPEIKNAWTLGLLLSF